MKPVPVIHIHTPLWDNPRKKAKDSSERLEKNYTSEYLLKKDINAMKKQGYTVLSQTRHTSGDFTVVYVKR